MKLTLKNLATTATLVIATLAMQSPANALGPAANTTQTGFACTNSGGNVILRAGPGQKFAKLMGVGHGAGVVVLDEVTGRDGMTWYKVKVGKKVGYMRYDFVCGL